MVCDYDAVIVGAGIAGLMSAARLALLGKRVGLFERGLIGSQATTSNHGMVHSGALYAKLHGDIVPHCAEAAELFSSTFPAALVARGAYYFAHKECVEQHAVMWDRHGVRYRWAHRDEVDAIFRPDRTADLAFALVDDLAVSSRRLVMDLVCLCKELGVQMHVRVPVEDILVTRGRTVGVLLAGRREVIATDVILCAGLGTRELAVRRSLGMRDRLKSRIDMMASFEGKSAIKNSLVCLDYGGPAIAPTASGTLLASLHGGAQPWVTDLRRFPVPVVKILDLIERLRFHFREGLIDYDSGQAYMCSKTELAGGNADVWGIEPGFAVVDHGREDAIEHLYTLLPGKMTLGFHASRDLVSRVLGAPVALTLPKPSSERLAEAEGLVDRPPWQALDS